MLNYHDVSNRGIGSAGVPPSGNSKDMYINITLKPSLPTPGSLDVFHT